jgi:hypothetical protein
MGPTRCAQVARLLPDQEASLRRTSPPCGHWPLGRVASVRPAQSWAPAPPLYPRCKGTSAVIALASYLGTFRQGRACGCLMTTPPEVPTRYRVAVCRPPIDTQPQALDLAADRLNRARSGACQARGTTDRQSADSGHGSADARVAVAAFAASAIDNKPEAAPVAYRHRHFLHVDVRGVRGSGARVPRHSRHSRHSRHDSGVGCFRATPSWKPWCSRRTQSSAAT